jgi:DNA-binding CsgD family transcriptional regulator
MTQQKRMNPLADLDRFIALLYRLGLSVPAQGFRGWALRELRELIPYDGALWGSGTSRDWRFNTVTLIGLPEEFPQVLEQTRTINPILPRLLSNLDTPVDMESASPDAEFFKSEIYKRCFSRFGISRILSTAHVDARSGLYSLLTLYRRDRERRFTDIEKALHKRATFHLFQSASHAFFLHLWRTLPPRPTSGGAAVVDSTGLFHEAQPGFLDLMEAHFPQRQMHTLPFAIPPPGAIRIEGPLCVRTEPFGDLFCVYVWPAGPLDRLTDREREIVMAVSQGLSFKEAARKIGLAPSTVANHLYRIYRKLSVHSRTELAALVHPNS